LFSLRCSPRPLWIQQIARKAERIGHIDSGLVASQVEQVRQAFRESFNAAFTGTLRLSMTLPIAIALLVILLMNGKGKTKSDVRSSGEHTA
jgi:hypothetical protein